MDILRRGVITVTPRLSDQDDNSVPPFLKSRKSDFAAIYIA